jgi:hypothetical protein
MAVYNTTEYYIWMTMKQRCCNPNNNRYKFYGGRGIKRGTIWSRMRRNDITADEALSDRFKKK